MEDTKKDGQMHDPCGKEFIKGGLAEGYIAKDIAAKHGVPVEDIEEQISAGTIVERKEHTEKGLEHIAAEIAKDHLMEHPKYYDFLKKMEKEMDKDYEAHNYGVEEKPRGKPGSREEEAAKDNLEEDPELKRQKTIKRLFG